MARPEATGPDIVAAGAVVVRKATGKSGGKSSGAREVLVVHRPKYDDWSFPKGKQDPGEHVTETAVREVLEETGVEIRLGRPLRPQLYAVGGGRGKVVHYWVGHVVGDDDVSSYEPNAEVDELAWIPVDEAARTLTYLDDIHLLDQLREEPRPTAAVVVVRHAKAVKRGQWDHDDWLRPLNDVGAQQSEMLCGLLRAYGVTQVVTSSATRCCETVTPYADQQVLGVEEVRALSEEAYDAGHARGVLDGLRRARQSSVVCSHRPILPDLLAELGTTEEPLAPAEMVVCHHRHGRLVATERHLPG